MGHLLVVSGSGRGRESGIWGPRAHALARALAAALGDDAVTVAYPARLEPPRQAPARAVPYGDQPQLRALLGAHEVVVARCAPPDSDGVLEGRLLALDCATWPLDRGHAADDGAAPRFWNRQLALADFLVAASEEQRDLLLGQMMALGLISPRVYDADPALEAYVAVVLQGVEPSPRPGGQDAGGPLWVLWSGVGDPAAEPETVFRAAETLAAQGVNLRLAALDCASFLYREEAAAASLALARRRGLTEGLVAFVPGPPGSPGRDQAAAAADVAVRAFRYPDAARYRFFAEESELLALALPVVSTAGDPFAGWVRRRALGLTCEPGDAEGLAAGLRRLLTDRRLRARSRKAAQRQAEQLGWETVCRPLVAFCRGGRSVALPRAERRSSWLRRALDAVVTGGEER